MKIAFYAVLVFFGLMWAMQSFVEHRKFGYVFWLSFAAACAALLVVAL